MNQFHPLVVASVSEDTRDTIVVTFAVPPDLRAAFRYVQGQHLTLRGVIDGEELRRSYSICSAAQDELLRVAIKRTPGGVFSNWANDHWKPGAVVDVMAPSGHFHVALDAAQRRHCWPSRTAVSRSSMATGRRRRCCSRKSWRT
jgi:ring-1,2-phenylacetyl-CoA epoxidase subunit PaaE